MSRGADTLTTGFVWTPPSIPGFSATVDYYDIALQGTIGALDPEQILWTRANTGDPVICGLIHRDSA
jgi:iron complex outermembrane receptor protein